MGYVYFISGPRHLKIGHTAGGLLARLTAHAAKARVRGPLTFEGCLYGERADERRFQLAASDIASSEFSSKEWFRHSRPRELLGLVTGGEKLLSLAEASIAPFHSLPLALPLSKRARRGRAPTNPPPTEVGLRKTAAATAACVKPKPCPRCGTPCKTTREARSHCPGVMGRPKKKPE